MDSLTDDIICALAPFGLPRDFANLALTCKCLGGKPGGLVRKKRKNLYSTRKRRKISHPEKVPGASNVDGREWYLMEAAAKKMVDAAKEVDDEWSDSKLSERTNGKESWIVVYRRLRWLRTSLVFSQIIGNISRIFPTSHENWEALCRIYDYHKREGRGVIFPVGLMRPIHQGASARTKS